MLKLIAPLDPRLSQICDPVTNEDDLSFIQDMKRILQSIKAGVGLAAPQIGINKRVIIIKQQNDLLTMMNPSYRVMEHSKSVADVEGCLSFPGTFVRVFRENSIFVDYITYKKFKDGTEARNEVIYQHLSGLEARIFQHEMEHLEGICQVKSQWRKDRLVAAQAGKLPRRL